MAELQIEEILQKLHVLKHHPRDLPENRALLLRGSRLFEFFLGEERAWIDKRLRRWPRLMGLFMGLECLFSLLILCGLFAGVLFILVTSLPAKGEGFSGLVPLFLVLIEWLVLWSVWPKNVPGLRRPGIAVARLLDSPWRLLVTLDFSLLAFPLAAAYGAFCYLILNELIKLTAGFP